MLADNGEMPAQTTSRPRVLLVEDDPALRWLVREILTWGGYEVTEAGSLGEAQGVLRRRYVDAVVLDRNLPDGDGLRLLRHPALVDARVLTLTVRSREHDFEEAYEAGVDEYLVKPFQPDDLLGALERLLRASPDEIQRKRRRELRRARLIERVERVFQQTG